MAQVASNFEVLANATVPTTSNTNFTTISAGAGNTLVADNVGVTPRTGKTSALKVLSASVNSDFASFNSTTAWVPSGLNVFGRGYFYLTAFPGTTISLFGMLTGALGSQFSVRVNPSGLLRHYNAAGAQALAGTVAVPLNQWFRVEFSCVISATVGQSEVKLFKTADSLIADEDTTSTAAQNYSTALPGHSFVGITQSASGSGFWASDIAFSDSGFLGPDLPPQWTWTYTMTQG